MKHALVIGTGCIALGVAGELLHDAGWHVTFAGRNADRVAQLRGQRAYHLQLVSRSTAGTRLIDDVDAVMIDSPEFRAAAFDADLVVTAVGAGNLADVAGSLVEPLLGRRRPVDVLAFENLASPGGALRAAFDALDPSGRLRGLVGCGGGLVARAVSSVEVGNDGLLLVTGDPVREVVVEGGDLRAELPIVDGLRAVDQFDAYIERKLFVFSAGHATAAYLGHLKGYRYVHAAVRDPEIRAAVLASMREGQQGIAARYGNAFAAYAGQPGTSFVDPPGDSGRGERALAGILDRFANAALADPVARVGRDPRRKLASGDRLLGAADLAGRAGVAPNGLLLAAAAALCFDDASDPSAAAIRAGIMAAGVPATLVEQCGVPERSALLRAVADRWERLTSGWRPQSPLLSIDQAMWA